MLELLQVSLELFAFFFSQVCAMEFSIVTQFARCVQDL